jgi:hypothetical protein
MPDQPQWSERTLDMPPQDPWADPPTTPQPPWAPAAPAAEGPFSRGRAQVNPRPSPLAAGHEPTGTGWPGAGAPEQRRPVGRRLDDLRRGGEWSSAALLFAFVCWGIWAVSTDGDFITAVIIFVISLLVAGGIFALSRLVGRVVLEKQLHRVRRTARGSHLITAVFLVGVGLAHLQQTAWVMRAFTWVVGLFN